MLLATYNSARVGSTSIISGPVHACCPCTARQSAHWLKAIENPSTLKTHEIQWTQFRGKLRVTFPRSAILATSASLLRIALEESLFANFASVLMPMLLYLNQARLQLSPKRHTHIFFTDAHEVNVVNLLKGHRAAYLNPESQRKSSHFSGVIIAYLATTA